MTRKVIITLTDAEFARLRGESERTVVSLSELVRRALRSEHRITAEALSALDQSFGDWSDRDFDGESYVEALRPDSVP